MFRSPRKTIANCNNVCTVSLPLTEIDINVIVRRVTEAIGMTSLGDFPDVNIEDVSEGNVLVYNEAKRVWQNTNHLDGSRTSLTIKTSENSDGKLANGELAYDFDDGILYIGKDDKLIEIGGSLITDNIHVEQNQAGDGSVITIGSKDSDSVKLFNPMIRLNGSFVSLDDYIQYYIENKSQHTSIATDTIDNGLKITEDTLDHHIQYRITLNGDVWSIDNNTVSFENLPKVHHKDGQYYDVVDTSTLPSSIVAAIIKANGGNDSSKGKRVVYHDGTSENIKSASIGTYVDINEDQQLYVNQIDVLDGGAYDQQPDTDVEQQ